MKCLGLGALLSLARLALRSDSKPSKIYSPPATPASPSASLEAVAIKNSGPDVGNFCLEPFCGSAATSETTETFLISSRPPSREPESPVRPRKKVRPHRVL